MADTGTVIGENIRITGHVSGEEDLTVFGWVEGTVELSQSLHVEPSGIIKANVSVATAVVSGVVVGNITASTAVELLEGGRMVGNIVAPRVVIADGAAFRGHIDMGEVDAPAASASTGASARSGRATSPRRGTSRPAARPARAAARPAARKEEPAPEPAKAPAKKAPEKKAAAKPAEKPAAEVVAAPVKATRKKKAPAAKEAPAES
jgi:cytoskeletal protein CcmA (bactofilin family)